MESERVSLSLQRVLADTSSLWPLSTRALSQIVLEARLWSGCRSERALKEQEFESRVMRACPRMSSEGFVAAAGAVRPTDRPGRPVPLRGRPGRSAGLGGKRTKYRGTRVLSQVVLSNLPKRKQVENSW